MQSRCKRLSEEPYSYVKFRRFVTKRRATWADTCSEVCYMSSRNQAQGLVEYGLIIALVAVLGIAALILFGPAVNALLSSLSGSV